MAPTPFHVESESDSIMPPKSCSRASTVMRCFVGVRWYSVASSETYAAAYQESLPRYHPVWSPRTTRLFLMSIIIFSYIGLAASDTLWYIDSSVETGIFLP